MRNWQWKSLLRKAGLVLGCTILAIASFALAMIAGVAGAVAPVLGVMVAFLLSRLPLRIPVLVLVCLILTLDNPNDMGPWASPLLPLGQLLSLQLKKSLPAGFLVLSGADTCLLLFFMQHWWREVTGNQVDRRGAAPTPKELTYMAWVSLTGTILALIWGIIRGGDMRWGQWQIERVLHLPLWAMFFGTILRGRADIKIIGRAIIGVALIRAVAAVAIRKAFPDAETATSHTDSMVFAIAFMLIVLINLEEPIRKNRQKAALILPILAAGMIANDRRIVWAHVAISCIFVFLMTRWNGIKIKLVRFAVLVLPAGVIYVVIGWASSGTGIFRPVGTLRSMIDAKSDASSNWRELENYNLHATFMDNPILGTGWGHPFKMVVELPDVTAAYELEPYIPHNSILGLWAYSGLVGFTCIWLMLAAGVFFALLAYRNTRSTECRVACMAIIVVIIVGMMQAFGDMGVGTWPWVFFLGGGISLAGKLAVETGAWPLTGKRGASVKPSARPHPRSRSTGP